MAKKKQKLCARCNKKPVYVKQAKYCQDCSPVVAREITRASRAKYRQKNHITKIRVRRKPEGMPWSERRKLILECVKDTRYTNRLTDRQRAGQ